MGTKKRKKSDTFLSYCHRTILSIKLIRCPTPTTNPNSLPDQPNQCLGLAVLVTSTTAVVNSSAFQFLWTNDLSVPKNSKKKKRVLGKNSHQRDSSIRIYLVGGNAFYYSRVCLPFLPLFLKANGSEDVGRQTAPTPLARQQLCLDMPSPDTKLLGSGVAHSAVDKPMTGHVLPCLTRLLTSLNGNTGDHS